MFVHVFSSTSQFDRGGSSAGGKSIREVRLSSEDLCLLAIWPRACESYLSLLHIDLQDRLLNGKARLAAGTGCHRKSTDWIST